MLLSVIGGQDPFLKVNVTLTDLASLAFIRHFLSQSDMSLSPSWSICEAIFAVSSAKVPVVSDSYIGKSAVNSK